MNWFESFLLGLLQGLTEYLPISSSGHLAIASSLFGIDGEQNMAFTVLVHVATVLSTLVILWKEIVWIFRDLFTKQSWKSYSGLNEGTRYAINIIISMIPVGIVGVFFKAASEGEHLRLACVHHRNCTGSRSASGHFPFRLDHSNRYHARQQEGASGTVLIPDGDSAHSG